MARAYNLEAEQKLVMTVLDGRKDLSAHAIGRITTNSVGDNNSIEIVARMLALLRGGKTLTSSKVFIEDPVLSKEAKGFLANIQFGPLDTKEDVDELIDILNLYKRNRTLLEGIEKVLENVKRNSVEQIDTNIHKLENVLLASKGVDYENKFVTFGEGDTSHAWDVLEEVLNPEDGEKILTGFKEFDRRTGGVRRQNLVVIGGPSSGGKTAVARQLVRNFYLKQHESTCVISLELGDKEELSRIVSGIANVPFDHLEQGKLTLAEKEKISDVVVEFDKVGKETGSRFSTLSPSGPITATQIISMLRPYNYDVIVVDYIGLLDFPTDEETYAIALGNISKVFKQAARALNCVVILLAQFDEENMKLKYSKAVYHHADVVMVWKYGEKEQNTGIVTIVMEPPAGKLRSGKPFKFDVHFRLDFMTVDDYENDRGNPDTQSEERSGPIGMGSLRG